MINSKEEFISYCKKVAEEEYTETINNNEVNFDSNYNTLSIFRDKNGTDNGFIVTIAFDEESNMVNICNGVDATGYDFELKEPTEDILDKLIILITTGKGFNYNQECLIEICGEYVDMF